ncbi:chaperonin 10-like protein [Coniella lustricola]|uniref:Chaperonin 10-like protein n=1 Tax=Coniella lustricola TaxID=2025994 RepID=A0A2T3ANG6_9PEZI|nr:chaperonin 10-like protein [Coniella lustricola]
MSSTSTTYKALVCTTPGTSEVQDLPVPDVSQREGYMLVRTKAVALNPTDWKSLHDPDGHAVGTKLGCDFAGVVEAVGPGVTKFVKGDRVCGFAFNAKNLERGGFGEYIFTPAEPINMKIPDNLSFEEAATLGVGVTTVGQGLYQFLELPLPSKPLAEPIPILINGGSTATGILGIQYAKASNLTVHATASPHNFDYLRSLGADHLYDYHTETDTLAAQIRAATNNSLAYAWDCITTRESMRLAALSLSDKPGVEGAYGVLTAYDREFVQGLNPNVKKVGLTMGYTAFGEGVKRSVYTWHPSREDWEFGKMFWELSEKLLADGTIKPARYEVNRGGERLEGVQKGLDELKSGKVSGVKLVYTFE